jgi:Tol biopolymer transport system component
MAFAAGTRLGPYEIVAKLGEGGMGEVYRARDTRLQREVALKTLPASFGSDADRRARFEREAQAIAALSHPNILAIHDFGTTTDAPPISYIVTELLQGSTLRDRISEGPLPVRKAIDVAIQLARGLAAAHGRGIVHRDLKPENVFLLDDGQVKILDFGLARPGASAGHASETALAVTDPGTVMGTVGYMAPEQVRGQAVDARADLFSLGTVFYEMIAGRPAFKRDTAADTMSAILNQDPPDLAATRTDFPPALDRILRHSLEKNVNERFQTARDVGFALEALSGTQVSASGAAAVPPSARSRAWLPMALGAMALAAAGIGGYAIGHRGSSASDVAYERKTFEPLFIANARFMPDGAIAYSAARTGTTPELFVLRPDTVVPQSLGLKDVQLLSVSSKGELAVLTDAQYRHHRVFSGTLARLTVGSAPRPWLEHVTEADWSPDGSTVAVVRELEQNDGNQLEYPVGTKVYETKGYVSDPRVSPDGRRVAFVDHKFPSDDRGTIAVIDANKNVTTLTPEYWGVEGLAWTPDGSTLIYAAAEAVRPNGMEPFAVDASGRTPPQMKMHVMDNVFVQDVRNGEWLLSSVDTQSAMHVRLPGDSAERNLSWLDHSSVSSLSADGRTLIFTDENWSAGTSYAVGLRTTDGAPAVRLGPGAAGPLSPDGKWVAVASLALDQMFFYPTGPGDAKKLDIKPSLYGIFGWFPDNSSVLICGGAAGAKSRCYRQAIAGGTMTPVTPEGASGALIAPDGHIFAGSSAEEAFVYDPTGATPPVRIKGLTPSDKPIAVGSDSHSLIVSTRETVPSRIERVDILTGARTLVTQVAPPDQTGLTRFSIDAVIADGKGYAYTTTMDRGTLFVVTGAK